LPARNGGVKLLIHILRRSVSIFAPDEIKRRQESLGKEMARVAIDCALIHTADNVCYVTGVPLLSEWGRPMWTIVEPSGRSVLIGANIERENMGQEGVVEQVRVYGDDEDVWTSALSIAAEIIETSPRATRGASKLRVGVEFQHITAGILRSLQDLLPTADFVDVSELLARLRIIKSDDEIRLLTLAGTVAQAGARAFLDAVHPGVTESEIAGSAVLAMNRSLAVSSPACLSSSYAYCQAGEHTLTPHLHPTGRPLRIGDVVALNVFAVASGYCVELERTFILGNPSKEQERIWRAVTASFEKAKSSANAGVSMSAIDEVATESLKQADLGQFIRHGTGHAHGIMVGAASREGLGEIRSYNRRLLQPNMVFSIEPGVYLPDVGGFRHSDVMVVGNDTTSCITEFPSELSYQEMAP
jgi:Xaa-Pro aminopeptidase